VGVGRRSCVGRRVAWRRGGRGLLCLDCGPVLISTLLILLVLGSWEGGEWMEREREREREEEERGELHLHGIELLFLGYDLVDVRCEEGVRCHDLVADRALDGGFYFAL
jgi:hypothetical protein